MNLRKVFHIFGEENVWDEEILRKDGLRGDEEISSVSVFLTGDFREVFYSSTFLGIILNEKQAQGFWIAFCMWVFLNENFYEW